MLSATTLPILAHSRRSRRLYSMWNLRTGVKIAVMVAGCLWLLMACAGHPTATSGPTRTQLPPSTPIPDTSPSPILSPTPSPAPTRHTRIDPRVAADLAVQVWGPADLGPGETAVYTLTIHNQGPAPATDIVLTDHLTGGLIPIWAQPTQPICGRQERNVDCYLDLLPGSQAVTITLDLSVGGSETLITGTQLAGVHWDLSAPTCAIDRGPNRSEVTCRLAQLQPGADARIRVGLAAEPGATGSLAHTATVAANEPDENDADNRASHAMAVRGDGLVGDQAILSAPDLVVQTNAPQSVMAGQLFTTTFTIVNRGAREATGVAFESVLPAATVLEGYAPSLPTCEPRDDGLTCALRPLDSSETITLTVLVTGPAGQPVLVSLDSLLPGWPICSVLKERTYLHILNCELGTLKPDQSIQVHMALTALGVQAREIESTASVNANETDSHPGDNSSRATVAVQVQADLSVATTLSGPAMAGETLSYTLTVANQGPSDAAHVVLTDILPMRTSLVSAVPSQGGGSCLQKNDGPLSLLICDLGRLESQGTASIDIVLALSVAQSQAPAEPIFHVAEVWSQQVDPETANNVLAESIPIRARD